MLVLAVLIPFWVVKGTRPTGHAALWVLYGMLAASAVIWIGATLTLRWRRAAAPQAEPSRRRGIVNLDGGRSRTKGSHFGSDLDTHIENIGEGSESEDEGSTFE